MSLNKHFKPKATYDLIRLGEDTDGGYLVEKESIQKARSLISFGFGGYWGFEIDFLKQNNIPLDVYDPFYYWLSYFRGALSRGKGLLALKIFLDHLKKEIFFRKEGRNFYKERVIMNLKTPFSESDVSVDEALKRQEVNLPTFFSIDIEYSEYYILDALIQHADKICGLVIEFHHVYLHQERIASFIEKFPLTLVHIHPNNAGGFTQDGNPFVLEMTFAKDPKPVKGTPTLPHPLDQTNFNKVPDLTLKFESD